MSTHRVTLDIEINDDALREHVKSGRAEDHPPPCAEVEDWDGTDYFRAADEGIVDPHAVVLHWYDGEVGDE